LTAETVIRALEDAEDYVAFEMAVTADYDARSAAVETNKPIVAAASRHNHRDWTV
jgi:hypothetical protein